MISVIISTVDIFFWLLDALIMARIIISWLPFLRNTVLDRIVLTLTEPMLGPIRYLLQKSPLGGPGMMLDFSPLIAFLLLEGLKRLVFMILIGIIGG